MKIRRVIGVLLAIAGAAVFVIWGYLILDYPEPSTQPFTFTSTTTDQRADRATVAVVAEHLTIPWGVAFLPDGSMLVTERSGTLVHLNSGRTYPVDGVAHVGEGGLLGIAPHPAFAENRYIYLYHTTRDDRGLLNRVVRYTYEDDTLSFDRIIIDDLPGARYHDGGRIAFGPDGMLYITVGDAGNEDAAQNIDSLAGSILRLTPDGAVPEDNPYENAIWSYGHRNPQGLTWDASGRLWSTEHGRSGIRSGFDEINLIEAGANYGWPESQGDTVRSGTVAPAFHSGAEVTWAPASAAYYDGSVYFGGLRGETLYEAVIEGDDVIELRTHLVGEYGRIRTVTLGPDNYLYLTTSNRDGRGDPAPSDDRIIRVDADQL